MLITVNIPNELATQLRPFEKQLPRLLEYGLREFNATTQVGFRGMNEVLELFAKLLTPEEILALHPSEMLQTAIEKLLEKSRTEGLTPEEEQQWQQRELEIHYHQLEIQRQTVGVNRQNALDRIAADFQLEQFREKREERRQEFELNKLKLQFLNQYQMQQNEHEFQLTRDLTNFERNLQLAQLSHEYTKKLEEFRQNCENLRMQKRLEFEVFMFEKRKEYEWKLQEYGRETSIIVANISRESAKESAEYVRLLDRHPLNTLVTPTLDFYKQFKKDGRPVPPLVIISPQALEFDPVKNPANEWFTAIEPDLTDNLRDFPVEHYPIESDLRPAKFMNGYKTKMIGQENAVEILHWTHQSIPTLFIESKLGGNKIRIYFGYWEMMDKTAHYKKIVEFSRKELLYPLARMNARMSLYRM